MDKKLILLLWGLMISALMPAQTSLQLTLGRSNVDHYAVQAAAQTQVGERVQIGLEGQYSRYRYRFISAKQLSDGNAYWLSVPVSFKAYEQDGMRLDVYVRSRLRWLSTPAEVPPAQSFATEFDPGLILTFHPHDKWHLQSGVLMKMIVEWSPEQIMEQGPSSMILAGAHYQATDRIRLTALTEFGPANGARGDTMKFYQFLKLGIQYSLSATPSFLLPTF